MTAQRPTEVHMDIRDLLKIGDAQMRKPDSETGALLVGERQGTAFTVTRCIGMGVGDDPSSTVFQVGQETSSAVDDELKLYPGSTWSFAHTHGPLLVGEAARDPSLADIQYSRTLENHSAQYGVSLMVKVDPDGGGSFTFFNGDGQPVPWVLTGLDGRQYSQAEVQRSGWGGAWGRDRHGLSTTQFFTKELPSAQRVAA